MKRLSKPYSQMAARYDAIVVGSGYGGGVAASRLARMGLKVAVLERGEEIHPGQFPDEPLGALRQTQIHGRGVRKGKGTELFDLRVGSDINVLVGCGLGGTSLINANVSIEADPRVFDDPAWPDGLNDEDLEEGYRRARAMLQSSPYPDDIARWPGLNKLRAMGQAAEALGVPITRPPVNVQFRSGPNAAGVWQPACNLCGDCCSGCNTGAKNTTLMNYLADAEAFGAEIFCGLRVDRLDQGHPGWTVHFNAVGIGRESFGEHPMPLSADIVVLAAGTLGSTEILLRSREAGLSLSPALGSRFSGNGDVLAFGYNNDQPIDGIGLGRRARDYDWRIGPERPVGPTISGLIDLRGTDTLDEGMVIEEGAIPGGLGSFLPAIMALAAGKLGEDTDSGDSLSEKAREAESLLRGPYRGAVNHTQTFLVMSHDDAGGRMRLDNGSLRVDWPGVGGQPGFARVAANVKKAVAATGGTYVPNPIWTPMFGHDLVTVHPLGGCPMGRDAATGVVDGGCRVYHGLAGTAVHPGLYVCDGSVIPRSIGVNPLLTISAIAERAMIGLAKDRGLEICDAPAEPREQEPAPSGRPGVRFTERMAGRIWPAGGGAETEASFIVTVIAPDAERFLGNADHEAELIGTVHAPALSASPLRVVGGRFNLFRADPDRVDTRTMDYRMPLVAADGRRFYFVGRKTIHDDKGPDLWRDTTTLEVRIHEGDYASGPPLFEGILRIRPSDFLRQITTMRAIGARNAGARLKVLADFGRFFAGRLFETFGGPFARPSFHHPDSGRARRELRTGLPEIHHFNTADGKELRLTRYRGGGKGPVILSHGLGVSSLIFAIDTIDTNLLEYLYAAGYDCWLLDYRASIELGHAREQFTADDVADKDYPAAVGYVREHSGAETVQMVAHCYGAMSFAMAMLSGLKGVRSAVLSQIAAHADVPFFPQRLLAYLRATDMMRLMGVSVLDARASANRDLLARSIDVGLGFYPYRSDNRTRSATSRRITALYGQLYQLDTLNQATMDAMPEMFGKSNLAAFRQLARIARKGRVVRADGADTYLTEANLRSFAIPTLFVHGELNRAFSPSGTQKTMEALAAANGGHLYSRRVIPGTGHIDCIFGRDAAGTVYPAMVEHLDRTACP